MPNAQDFRIDLSYEKDIDGRYYIRSRDIPGFRLVGFDLDALQRDLTPVVIDLLHDNLQIDVESVHWVPSLQEVKQRLERPGSAGTFTYLAKMRAA